MVKSRIIPILLLRKGRMVKGRKFSAYRDVGDPVSIVKIYNAQNVDELIFLDIDATRENRLADMSIIESVSEVAFLPMTIGGGVRTVEDADRLLKAGADKVAINTAAVTRPDVVRDAARAFGRQCIVVSIDVKKHDDGQYFVHIQSGTEPTLIHLADHVRRAAELGAGEILINSIDRDGMMNGYDEEIIRIAHANSNLPTIISGGSGTLEHLYLAIRATNVSGVGCGSVFYFADNNPIRARSYLRQKGLPMRGV